MSWATTPPFAITRQTLVLSFFATAELGCFKQLGWAPPERLLDMYAEARMRWNGSLRPGAGLVDVAQRLHVGVVDETHKNAMRDIAIHNRKFTTEEQTQLMNYCEADVRTLSEIFLAAANSHAWFETPERLWQALFRGTATIPTADVEAHGIPVDLNTLNLLKAH